MLSSVVGSLGGGVRTDESHLGRKCFVFSVMQTLHVHS